MIRSPNVREGYYRMSKDKSREYVDKVEMFYAINKNREFVELLMKQPISMKKEGNKNVM